MLLHETVSLHAKRSPDNIAVVFKEESITYSQLEAQSNGLACMLQGIGCKRGDRIALLLPKSIPAVVAMLASLKAGCIYVPLDRTNPPVRLSNIIECCQPACVLAAESTATLLEATLSLCPGKSQIRIGRCDSNASAGLYGSFSFANLATMPASENGNKSTRPEDPAHILFTSGSTGIPKGVTIIHQNVAAFLKWAAGYFCMDQTDRISCHAPLHFDLSTFDIWGAFLVGAQLHLLPQETAALPKATADFIRQNKITHWLSVPSALRYMAESGALRFEDFPSLRRVLWAGEVFPTATLKYWMDRVPNAEFTNLYGPTETTVASSYYTVPRQVLEENAEVPIGKPCEGEDLLLLDDALRPVASGESGEIYIRGAGLSPGYWGEPARTESAFLTHAFHGRIYRTGDLARLGKDGLIYFLGRADSQIKSRGYRIELGEIETALRALTVLRDCAVVAVPSSGFEGTTICCAYVPSRSETISGSDLRRLLGRTLPPYMLPAQWMDYQTLPLNSNGKIDRSALKTFFSAQIEAKGKAATSGK